MAMFAPTAIVISTGKSTDSSHHDQKLIWYNTNQVIAPATSNAYFKDKSTPTNVRAATRFSPSSRVSFSTSVNHHAIIH